MKGSENVKEECKVNLAVNGKTRLDSLLNLQKKERVVKIEAPSLKVSIPQKEKTKVELQTDWSIKSSVTFTFTSNFKWITQFDDCQGFCTKEKTFGSFLHYWKYPSTVLLPQHVRRMHTVLSQNSNKYEHEFYSGLQSCWKEAFKSAFKMLSESGFFYFCFEFNVLFLFDGEYSVRVDRSTYSLRKNLALEGIAFEFPGDSEIDENEAINRADLSFAEEVEITETSKQKSYKSKNTHVSELAERKDSNKIDGTFNSTLLIKGKLQTNKMFDFLLNQQKPILPTIYSQTPFKQATLSTNTVTFQPPYKRDNVLYYVMRIEGVLLEPALREIYREMRRDNHTLSVTRVRHTANLNYDGKWKPEKLINELEYSNSEYFVQ